MELHPGKNISKLHKLKTTSLLLACLIVPLAGCNSTTPILGGSKGNTVSGGAGGASTQGENAQLEKCSETLGTLAVVEEQEKDWWRNYVRRYPQLGSTVPVLRLMIQQSNCFVVVERGRAMANMIQERQLQKSGEIRKGSNFGKGQIVAADFAMNPSIQFAENGTGGLGGAIGGLFGSVGAAIGGGLKSNEAATTLLLTDNRSGVQVSASVGSAKNFDFALLGGALGGGFGAGAGGFSKTPQGKVITAAFVDSYNQMVRSLRSYKAQQVKGGLGKGGRLKVGK